MSDLVFKNVAKAAAYLAECRDVTAVRDIRDKAKAIEAYQRHRHASLDAQLDAGEIGLRAERQLGRLCLEITGGKAGKRKANDTTLGQLGITTNQSSRWQDVWEVPEPVFENYLATTRAKGERLTTAGAIAAVSDSVNYDTDEWFTPKDYIEAARNVMGGIELDPASSAKAQRRVKATRYFTKKDDGLSQPWNGNVWLNPPYSTALVGAFTNRLLDEYNAGNVKAAVMLVNNSTDAKWCQRWLRECDVFCLTDHRIAFVSPDGTPYEATRRGQIIFGIGVDKNLFETYFCDHGFIGISV